MNEFLEFGANCLFKILSIKTNLEYLRLASRVFQPKLAKMSALLNEVMLKTGDTAPLISYSYSIP